jgi:3D (Asp-Asp-Asp) domain-containing protein
MAVYIRRSHARGTTLDSADSGAAQGKGICVRRGMRSLIMGLSLLVAPVSVHQGNVQSTKVSWGEETWQYEVGYEEKRIVEVWRACDLEGIGMFLFEDRMPTRKTRQADLYIQSRQAALQFGVKETT